MFGAGILTLHAIAGRKRMQEEQQHHKLYPFTMTAVIECHVCLDYDCERHFRKEA